MHSLLIEVLNNFARGGGGGSGGGSGSGEGGLIIVIGYMPTHFIGHQLAKRWKSPNCLYVVIAVSIIIAIFWIILFTILSFGFIGWIVAGAALAGGPVGYYTYTKWFANIKKTKIGMSQSAISDKSWDENSVTQMVRQTFVSYQQDWSNFNVDNMRKYLSPYFWQYNYLMMLAIKLRQRTNMVQNPELIELAPYAMDDEAGENQDKLTYYIKAKARDVIYDNFEQKELFVDNNDFIEYWNFTRDNEGWQLDSIKQATENPISIVPEISQFATDNGLFYSPDWGWLLLPQRGQLFSKAKFGLSDINNHVIGMYHDVLIELYTYVPTTKNTRLTYIIAQLAIPKRYEDLIIKAKNSFWKIDTEQNMNLFKKDETKLNRISLEWPDFNKRYKVFATNVEQVTAFELLHPVFMEKLFALKFKVSIEVIDNVIYLYTQDNNAKYEQMFSVLKDAFEEMKL